MLNQCAFLWTNIWKGCSFIYHKDRARRGTEHMNYRIWARLLQIKLKIISPWFHNLLQIGGTWTNGPSFCRSCNKSSYHNTFFTPIFNISSGSRVRKSSNHSRSHSRSSDSPAYSSTHIVSVVQFLESVNKQTKTLESVQQVSNTSCKKQQDCLDELNPVSQS
jgi:hypothetical protein